MFKLLKNKTFGLVALGLTTLAMSSASSASMLIFLHHPKAPKSVLK